MKPEQLDSITTCPDRDHDSLVLRFDHLERILQGEIVSPDNQYVRRSMRDALDLVKLIRAQVLK